jgi:hypothetical protein
MLSAEDDPEDTIVPRLSAAGADLTRITFIKGIAEYRDDGALEKSWVSLDRHIEQLAQVLRQRHGNVRLLVIDPISAYLGKDIVLVVTQLMKSDSSTAIYRVTGSLRNAVVVGFHHVGESDGAHREVVLDTYECHSLTDSTVSYSG